MKTTERKVTRLISLKSDHSRINLNQNTIKSSKVIDESQKVNIIEIEPKILNTNKSNKSIAVSRGNTIKEIDKSSEITKLDRSASLIKQFNTKNLAELHCNKDDIKSKCLKIFNNFAKIDNEESLISHQTILKILRFIGVLHPNLLKIYEIDLLFKKVNKYGNKLNKDQFMDFLVLLTEKIDPENFSKYPKETTANIITNFFEPFNLYIKQHDIPDSLSNNYFCEQSLISFLEKFTIENDIISIIKSIYCGLKEIYLCYFKYEDSLTMNLDLIQKASFKSLNEFCHDFEIEPYLFNKNQISWYWEYLQQKKLNFSIFGINNLGQIFTLDSFSLFLIHIGVFSFPKISLVNYKLFTDKQKLIFFLERLENSSGKINLSKKSGKPYKISNSLIPNLKEENAENEENLIQSHVKTVDSTLFAEVESSKEENLNNLQNIFNFYCKFGDKINFNQLSLSGYLKFLKDLGILLNNEKYNNSLDNHIKLRENEAIAIFSSNPKNNINNKARSKSQTFSQSFRLKSSDSNNFSKINKCTKMNFENFLSSFKDISEKIYPHLNYEESGGLLLNEVLKKCTPKKNSNEILEKLESCRVPDMIEVIKDVSFVVSAHFSNYSNNSSLMRYDDFFNFYKDFSIFPDLINLIKLKEIFYSLSELYFDHFIKNKLGMKDTKTKIMSPSKTCEKESLINFDLFLDSLAVTSKLMKFSYQYEENEKLLYLIEKIMNSKGVTKIQKRNGENFNLLKEFSNHFAFLREKYPNFYQKKKNHLSKPSKKFNSIFDEN